MDIQAIYHKLFCTLYHTGTPCVPLQKIIHWHNGIKKLGLDSQLLHSELAYVMPGYFYGFSSNLPDNTQMVDALQKAHQQQAQWVLLPVVRYQANLPAQLEQFQAIPSFFESIYQVKDSLNKDLYQQLGKKRYKALKSNAVRLEKEYTLEFVSGKDVLKNPEMLMAFDTLHQYNIKKYNHAYNHFNLEIVNYLLSSPLGEQIVFLFYRHRMTQSYVLSSLNLLDKAKQKLYFVAVGIDHFQTSPKPNLYLAAVYHLYLYGIEQGVSEFNFGRGLHQDKLKVGANQFYILSNYLLSLKNEHTAELATLVTKSKESIRNEINMLQNQLDKNNISMKVALPKL